MPAQIIDGKALAAELRKDVAARVAKFQETNGFAPTLAVVLVGENAASKLYVKMKEEACVEVGIKSIKVELPEDVSQEDLLRKIQDLNENPEVHGILVQLPVPAHISESAVTEAVSPSKDVDGFTSANMGKLLAGLEGLAPATPRGMMRLLDSTEVDCEAKHAVVVGRSLIVGRPTAVMLVIKKATTTVTHRYTKGLEYFTKQADIIVTAVGKQNLIKADMIKEGAIIIDAGIVKTPEGKVVGDVDFEAVKEKASWITPVPGGVGPMTVATLMENALLAAEWQVKDSK